MTATATAETHDARGTISTTDPVLRHANAFAQVPIPILFCSDLSHGAVRVYAALYWYAWRSGWAANSYPGHKQLCADIGLKDRQVRDYLQELIGHKLIECHRPGHGQPNEYTLLTIEWEHSEPPAPDPEEPPSETGSIPPGRPAASRRSRSALSRRSNDVQDSKALDSTTIPTNPPEGNHAVKEPPAAPAPEPDGGGGGVIDIAALNDLTSYGVIEANARKVLAEQQPTLREVRATIAGCRSRNLGPGAVVNALRQGMYADQVPPEDDTPPPPDPEVLRLHRQRTIETLATTAAAIRDPDERAVWYYCSPDRPPDHLFDEVQDREAEIRGGTPPERLEAPTDNRLDAMMKQRAARDRLEKRRAERADVMA